MEGMVGMSVSAIGSSTSPLYGQPPAPPAPPPMTNTAKLLGLSVSQLTQDMKSGTTLESLASQKGISSSTLISTIESDLQANAPQGAPPSFSSVLDKIATSIANGTPPGGGHHGHHHHGGGDWAQLTSTAQLLGLSTSQLDQDLQSGTTLSSLATQAGVSGSSLISTIESDLQANAPQGAPALPSSQLNQIATGIANGTPAAGAGQAPGGGPGLPPISFLTG
jgi:lambda repressor-like predicted transcriptional regulator